MGEKIAEFFRRSVQATGRYFIGKTITSLIIALLCYIVFRIIGIHLSGLMAFIVFLTNFVPVFGPWVGALAAGLIALFDVPVFALYAVGVILVLQITEQFLLMPLIVGKAVELKPLIIVMAVILAGAFLGFWGILFAVPAAAVIKIAWQVFSRKKEKP
ncbi:MAG: AI-2E family transporter [Clostridia bacterium]